MLKNVNENNIEKNTNTANDSSVMSKIACHYVSLPKVILRRIDDPQFPFTLNPEERKTLKLFSAKSINEQNIKKRKPRSKNISLKKITVKTNNKNKTLQAKQPTKSQLNKQLNKRRINKPKKFSDTKSVERKKKTVSKPRKVLKVKTSPSPSSLKKNTQKGVKKTIKTHSEKQGVFKKKLPKITSKAGSVKKPRIIKTLIEISEDEFELPRSEMSDKDQDSITEELEKSDSEKSFEDSSDLLYDELIQSLEIAPKKAMADPGIRKQALSKNVIKLSSSLQKSHGGIIKSGIIRKNNIPIQAKSKQLMKPNKVVSSVNLNQIKNISVNSPIKQKVLVSPLKAGRQKQMVLQTSKTKTPMSQMKQKAITVQSVEAINSKAKKTELVTQTSQKTVGGKQTATVTPLSKARKSFSSGSIKTNVNNKVSNESESDGMIESEPVNLLSKLVGLPISASKLQVVSLSPKNAVQIKSSTSPPLTNNNNNNTEGPKTQHVSPTTHETDVKKNALDLLKILGDESEGISTEQEIESSVDNGVEMKTLSKASSSKSGETLNTDSELSEGKQRTIYDLISDINLVYPSWNLHIMPDTNTFCIAQIARGRLGIPVLKKCIELDESYNAKVYVHQYHCKKFDGQYDSEESIIALIHEINALRA